MVLEKEPEVDNAVRVIGAQRPLRLGVETKQAVRVVLDNQQAGPLADAEHLGPALGAERDPGGVVERGDRVQELHPLALAGEPGDAFIQCLGYQPVVVHRHVHDTRLVGSEGSEGSHVGGPLGQDHVPWIDEDAGDEVERLLRADRDDHVVGMGMDSLQRHHLADALAQCRVALPRPVLQSDRAMLGNQLAGHLAHGIQRQGGDVGHPAGQRHDLRPGGHREQGPDLRGNHAPGPCCVPASMRVHQRPV